MWAALVLLENIADATQSVKLYFFAVLLIDKSNEWWSLHNYQYVNGCLSLFASIYGNWWVWKWGSCLCSHSDWDYKTEPGIHVAL